MAVLVFARFARWKVCLADLCDLSCRVSVLRLEVEGLRHASVGIVVIRLSAVG